ncbi:MAG: nucleoside recognition domain-containing protein [Flavisolibacter sp.]
MALNYVWVSFFLLAFVAAMAKLIGYHDVDIFQKIVTATFDSAKTGAEISLGLIGIMAFWLGIMKIGERGGMIKIFARAVRPFFSKLFPEIPRDHPAYGSILMNFSANMLGLDNAATPMGLKAMKELQEINPDKETATNAQIMFLVLNASSLTLLPISIMAYRKEAGAVDPSDIFIPILLATFFSTLTGLVVTALYQRINLFQRTILLYLGSLAVIIAGLLLYFTSLSPDEMNVTTKIWSNVILYSIVASFIALAVFRRINVFEAFIDGAKEGFEVAIKIIPYLVGILVAVGVLRASGVLDFIMQGIGAFFGWFGINTDFVPALPVALMKPLSGGGARGLLIDLMNTSGADSFPSRVASVIQGSTETTFYVLAVYFGSVSIKKTRHALPAALLAELGGVIAAIIIAYIFFH